MLSFRPGSRVWKLGGRRCLVLGRESVGQHIARKARQFGWSERKLLARLSKAGMDFRRLGKHWRDVCLPLVRIEPCLALPVGLEILVAGHEIETVTDPETISIN